MAESIPSSFFKSGTAWYDDMRQTASKKVKADLNRTVRGPKSKKKGPP